MAPYFKSNLLCQSSHAREVCFPGGKCDSDDETNVEAALRETNEELGIPTDRIEVWTHMQPIANHKGMVLWNGYAYITEIDGRFSIDFLFCFLF